QGVGWEAPPFLSHHGGSPTDRLEQVHVGSGAEATARARHDDDADVFVRRRRFEQIEISLAHLPSPRVEPVGAVQGQRQDAVGEVSQDDVVSCHLTSIGAPSTISFSRWRLARRSPLNWSCTACWRQPLNRAVTSGVGIEPSEVTCEPPSTGVIVSRSWPGTSTRCSSRRRPALYSATLSRA